MTAQYRPFAHHAEHDGYYKIRASQPERGSSGVLEFGGTNRTLSNRGCMSRSVPRLNCDESTAPSTTRSQAATHWITPYVLPTFYSGHLIPVPDAGDRACVSWNTRRMRDRVIAQSSCRRRHTCPSGCNSTRPTQETFTVVSSIRSDISTRPYVSCLNTCRGSNDTHHSTHKPSGEFGRRSQSVSRDGIIAPVCTASEYSRPGDFFVGEARTTKADER
jgi:hypothetical protein